VHFPETVIAYITVKEFIDKLNISYDFGCCTFIFSRESKNICDIKVKCIAAACGECTFLSTEQ